MAKFLVISVAASICAWFFYQGFTGQPYGLPPFLQLF
jgi:hypothetical protein